jgi:uncharacterized protein
MAGVPMGGSAALLGGAGRWTDPWHPFAETNDAVAAVAAEAGLDLDRPSDVDAALASYATGELPSLVVVNVGLPRDDRPVPLPEADIGYRRLLASGVPMLVLHVSTTSFADDADWETALGGVWVRGTTMHPPSGPAAVRVVDDTHPVTAGIDDFVLHDERYSFMRVSPAVRVLVDHVFEGTAHPLVWVHERPGGGTTVVDALGHDGRSYAAPAHRALLRNALSFLRTR